MDVPAARIVQRYVLRERLASLMSSWLVRGPHVPKGELQATEPSEPCDVLTPEQSEVLRTKLSWRRGHDSTGRFLSIFMDQNTRCNLRCRMCGFADPRLAGHRGVDMPRALFDRIAGELFPIASYLQLSIMTEPFMTRDFPDRLSLVRRYAVPYSHVITNGTLLTPDSIRKLIEAQITRLSVSLDGGTAATYERIRIGARFDKVLANLRLFQTMRREAGTPTPELRINHVVSAWNLDQFDEFLAFISELGPESLFVQAVEKMAPDTGDESLDPAYYERLREVREKLASFCASTGIIDAGFLRPTQERIDLFDPQGARMTCRRPWDTAAIHANGDLHPCMSWSRPPIGNLARQTFDEIWQGEAAEAVRREFESVSPGVDCQHCSIKKKPEVTAYDDFFYRMITKS